MTAFIRHTGKFWIVMARTKNRGQVRVKPISKHTSAAEAREVLAALLAVPAHFQRSKA